MAQTAVDIVVKVVGDQKLKQLDTSLKGTAANALKADNKLDGFSNAADRAGKSSAKASGNVSKLSAGLGKLAAAIGAAEVARRVLSIGLDSIGSSTRLAALTSQYGEFESAQRRVLAIQNKFNLTQVEATEQFSTAYARLKPLGFTLDEITDAYEGISTATKTAALDAGAANALFTQTAQALGSGVVQAEELNTIIDQAPTIVVALADELGVAAGEVKKLASDGKVSSQALLNALVKVKKDGVDLLATSLDTPGEKIKLFQRVTEQVVNALVTGVIADLAEAIKDIGLAIKDLTPVFQGLGTIAQVVMRPIIGLFRLGAEVAAGFGRVVANISEGNWQALIEPDTKALTNVKEIIDDIFAPLNGNLPNIPQGNLPSPTRTTRTSSQDDGSGSSGGGTLAADTLAQQMQAGEQLAQQFERNRQLREAEDQLAKDLLQTEFDRLDVIKQIQETAAPMQQAGLIELANAEALAVSDQLRANALKEQQEAREAALQPLIDEQTYLQDILQFGEDEAKIRQRINNIMRESPDLDRARVDEMVRGNAQLQERAEAVANLQQQYNQLASGIAGEMTGAFRSIIDGTKSVDEAFADMLKGIADKFLDMAMKILTDALTQQLMGLFANLLGGFGGGFGSGASAPIFGGSSTFSGAFSSGGFGIGGFADGGRPPLGQVSLVGERGPELFVPDTPGTVYSNEQSKSMLASSQYGPGNESMSAASTPSNYNINYNGPTLNFNGDDYIPRSEASQLIAAGAKQGEARTLNSLRNKRSTRSRIGI